MGKIRVTKIDGKFLFLSFKAFLILGLLKRAVPGTKYISEHGLEDKKLEKTPVAKRDGKLPFLFFLKRAVQLERVRVHFCIDIMIKKIKGMTFQ